MTIKDIVRPIPGVRRISILRQQLYFRNSASYWESEYAKGHTSGPGSYGDLGHGKAEFLNAFVRDQQVSSIIEFGCGDGHQLSLANYSRYIGLDVSPTAIGLCKARFADDQTKSFFLYKGDCFVDRTGLFTADAAISLDVIYHLIEDKVFHAYMNHLFAAGKRYVVVYSTNCQIKDDAPHVRHRNFSLWVDEHCPQWRLMEIVHGPDSQPGRADFFIYERSTYHK
jgi:SAM-dependent methyltransferase